LTNRKVGVKPDNASIYACLRQQSSSTNKTYCDSRGNSPRIELRSSYYRQKTPTELTLLPYFKNVPAVEQQELVLKNIQQCCVVFNFNDSTADMPSKEIKRRFLTKLIECIGSSKRLARIPIPTNHSNDSMCFKVRCLAYFDPEEDDPVFEVAWLHLMHVYECVLRVFELSKFFQLEVCLTAFRMGRVNCWNLNSRLRASTSFLAKVYTPLHKAKSLVLFHPQLAYYIVQFLEKESTLTEQVVKGLLKFWPKTYSQKEIMFLALGYWNNENIVSMFEENHEVLIPILFSSSHDPWKHSIVALIQNVGKYKAERKRKGEKARQEL
uniref:ELYS domain-containing protein n=1 Tax=Echinostoma caproni TaxID=27848 RepID=A0A183AVI9_9TREM